MVTIDTLQCKIRLQAGEIANMHWALDKVYAMDEDDPRLPAMRAAIDAKLAKHHNALEQLERVKIASFRSASREKRYVEFIRYKCVKVQQQS